MKKILSIALILTFVSFFGLVVINSSAAQVDGTVNELPAIEEMTTIDLGVENPGLLPTNPFYFFKEWGRGIRMFFTFSKVAKIAYQLEVANQKAAELKKVEEVRPDDAEAIQGALDNYNENVEKLETRLQSLQETSENPNVDKLLDQLADRAMKHQQLFEELKIKHEEINEKISNIQMQVNNTLQEVAGKLDTPEKFKERLNVVMQAQEENQLKELRAIQFINKIEENINSPEIIEKLAELKEEQVQKIEAKIKTGYINSSETGGLIEKLTSDQAERSKVATEIEEKTTDSGLKNRMEIMQKNASGGNGNSINFEAVPNVSGEGNKGPVNLEAVPKVNVSPDSIKVEINSFNPN